MIIVDELSEAFEDNERLFEAIASDIETKGFSIKPNALPIRLQMELFDYFMQLHNAQFHKAGIGRGRKYTKSRFVRTDKICWIHGESEAGARWLNWATELMTFLNRRLYLGLFSFESHFAHYRKGDYYKRHYDAFKGESNRVLSLVVYLNSGWTADDGGELVIYPAEDNSMFNHHELIKVTPLMGTVVLFLSEQFPHEVLTAKKDRFSIAGWYRLNANSLFRVDPDK